MNKQMENRFESMLIFKNWYLLVKCRKNLKNNFQMNDFLNHLYSTKLKFIEPKVGKNAFEKQFKFIDLDILDGKI